MQVHTPADQLLPPLEGDADGHRETRTRCEICFTSPSACRATEMRLLCSALLCSTYSPHTDTPRVCPGPSEKARQQGRSSIRGESSTTHPADMISARRSSCAVWLLFFTCWFESSQYQNGELDSMSGLCHRELLIHFLSHYFCLFTLAQVMCCFYKFILTVFIFACQTLCLYCSVYLLMSFVPYLSILLHQIIFVLFEFIFCGTVNY